MHKPVTLGVALLVALIGLCSGCGSPPSGSPEAAKGSIRYEVVEEWTLPNGGYGRAIAVDGAQRTEEGLLALANQLRRETQGDRNAFIFIYDDRRAAVLRKEALAEGTIIKCVIGRRRRVTPSWCRGPRC